jgi:hypothetical protein
MELSWVFELLVNNMHDFAPSAIESRVIVWSGNNVISNACQNFQIWWSAFSVHHLTNVCVDGW